MAYAGTYGADETCKHDSYWRSCSLCSEIGPRATDAQIQANIAKREREAREARVAEQDRQQAYERLDPDERVVAEALWGLIIKASPGLGELSLNDAVKGHHPGRDRLNSTSIGKARYTCTQAKIVVAALAAAKSSTK